MLYTGSNFKIQNWRTGFVSIHKLEFEQIESVCEAYKSYIF